MVGTSFLIKRYRCTTVGHLIARGTGSVSGIVFLLCVGGVQFSEQFAFRTVDEGGHIGFPNRGKLLGICVFNDCYHRLPFSYVRGCVCAYLLVRTIVCVRVRCRLYLVGPVAFHVCISSA